jgi:hypothetical protein
VEFTYIYFVSYSLNQAIHIIECVEFRRLLLLLREDLRDQDIPRRTKLREEIIKAWQHYFAKLKEDLKVRTTVHYCRFNKTDFLTSV